MHVSMLKGNKCTKYVNVEQNQHLIVEILEQKSHVWDFESSFRNKRPGFPSHALRLQRYTNAKHVSALWLIPEDEDFEQPYDAHGKAVVTISLLDEIILSSFQ